MKVPLKESAKKIVRCPECGKEFMKAQAIPAPMRQQGGVYLPMTATWFKNGEQHAYHCPLCQTAAVHGFEEVK
jgi:hypothetical protein